MIMHLFFSPEKYVTSVSIHAQPGTELLSILLLTGILGTMEKSPMSFCQEILPLYSLWTSQQVTCWDLNLFCQNTIFTSKNLLFTMK